MSIDAIKQVAQAEQETQARKAEAQAEAKRLLAEAERARVAARCSEADSQVGQLMKQAEERAAQRTKAVMEETAKTCDALRAAAKGRMAKAAGLIVERVVNS